MHRRSGKSPPIEETITAPVSDPAGPDWARSGDAQRPLEIVAGPLDPVAVAAPDARWRHERPAAPLLARLARLDAATWLVVLALPIGLLLVFAIPPFQGLDEPNHFYRAYTITEGALAADDHAGRTGGFVPRCVQQYQQALSARAGDPGPFSKRQFFQQPECRPQVMQFMPFENTAYYSPVAYAPQAAAVGVSRLLGLPVPVLYYAGRLAALAAYVGLFFLALRIAPVARSALFLVGVWPMSLLLATTYSADTLTVALVALLVAVVIRALHEGRTTWRLFAVAAAATVLLALSKSTYFVLAPLLLLLPSSGLPSKWAALAAKAAALAVVGVVSVAWYLRVKYISAAPFYPPGTINPAAQTSFVVHHPLAYARFMLTSLFSGPNAAFMWNSLVAQISNFRSPTRGLPYPPPWVVVLGYGLLLGAYVREAGPRLRRSLAAVASASLPAALVIVNVVLVFTAVYIQATAPNTPPVMGGRYFLPVLVLPLLSLVLLTGGRQGRLSVLPIVPFLLVMYGWLAVRIPQIFY